MKGDGLERFSDAELVERCRAAGDREAERAWLQELCRRYYPKVVTWCFRIAGDREEALDLAQAIFIKVHRHIRSFKGSSRLSTWLYSITRSECINYLRARSARKDRVEEELPPVADDSAESPEALLDRERSAEAVRALLDQTLDETEKRVFTLHYGDEVPLDAITRLLGLGNRSGAKAYIVSAKRKLARAVVRWRACHEVPSA